MVSASVWNAGGQGRWWPQPGITERPWGLTALRWAEREGSAGPRLGDQEDRRPPFLKTEKNKAPASERREWLIQRRPGQRGGGK